MLDLRDETISAASDLLKLVPPDGEVDVLVTPAQQLTVYRTIAPLGGPFPIETVGRSDWRGITLHTP